MCAFLGSTASGRRARDNSVTYVGKSTGPQETREFTECQLSGRHNGWRYHIQAELNHAVLCGHAIGRS